MAAYLKRLVSSLAAYQVADVVSKFIAVLLLPVYTRYIDPAGYGVVELLANGVILVSILIRFGMIESFLRFYYSDADQERRDALARRSIAFLLVATTVCAAVLAALAGPVSRIVLGYRDPTTLLVAVLGLWSFTNLELAYGLLRVDERLRMYATASVSNVLLTVAGSLVLVVGLGDGARGLLLGNYGASTVVLVALWWCLRGRLRPRRARVEPFGVLLRFGLPTVPAEASVYALSIIDRYYIFHDRSHSLAGLYSIAVKLAGAVAFIVRAFQYAWPPLAYSISDDAQAGRLYGLVTTYYLLVSGWVVAALALLGRWILALLAAPAFFGAYRALPWVALGWALYGLWVVLLVIAGRAQVTTRNFPASLAGLAANVVLLLVLVPRLG
ncbi:MAG: lipopolysaccharide biosynthesis protein, partial [Solirubrobacteraceae bacterium]